jgi:hypothetical protein
MLKRTLLTMFIFVLPLVWAPALVNADGVLPVPIISAPFVTVGVGDIFPIPISITGAAEVSSWQFDLAFDPAIVQADFVDEGPFLSSFGATLFTPGVIDNVAGLISLVADSYVDLPPNPSGDGVLANIEFDALAPGVSPLTFSNVFLNDLDTGFTVTNGQITVTGTAVPEPSTLVLFASGVGLLFVLQLARVARRRTM